jgi:hypothetical protein
MFEIEMGLQKVDIIRQQAAFLISNYTLHMHNVQCQRINCTQHMNYKHTTNYTIQSMMTKFRLEKINRQKN